VAIKKEVLEKMGQILNKEYPGIKITA